MTAHRKKSSSKKRPVKAERTQSTWTRAASGRIILFPTEPSVIGSEKIEAAVRSVLLAKKKK